MWLRDHHFSLWVKGLLYLYHDAVIYDLFARFSASAFEFQLFGRGCVQNHSRHQGLRIEGRWVTERLNDFTRLGDACGLWLPPSLSNREGIGGQ